MYSMLFVFDGFFDICINLSVENFRIRRVEKQTLW